MNETELGKDPDKDFIMNGKQHGFRITAKGSCFHHVNTNNYTSAANRYNHHQVEQQNQRNLVSWSLCDLTTIP